MDDASVPTSLHTTSLTGIGFFTAERGNEPALDVWPVVGALSPLPFWWVFSCWFLVFVEASSSPARCRCARCLARKAGLEPAWPAGGDDRATHNSDDEEEVVQQDESAFSSRCACLVKALLVL